MMQMLSLSFLSRETGDGRMKGTNDDNSITLHFYLVPPMGWH